MAIIPIIAGIGAGLAAGVGSQLVGAALDPAIRKTRYGANYLIPNLLPNANEIFACLNASLLSDADAQKLLWYNGIDWRILDKDELAETSVVTWESIRRMSRPMPDPAETLDYYHRGYLTADEFVEKFQLTGAWVGDWKGITQKYGNRLSLGDVMIAANRDKIKEKDVDEKLKRIGIVSATERDIVQELRKQIPGVQDLIRFMVRDVLDKDAVIGLGLYKDYPREINPLLKAQGLYGDTGIDGFGKTQEKNASWGEIYWAAHWQPISPTQAYELLHRIREDKNYQIGDEQVPLKAFKAKDVSRWLKIADYPPAIRDYLAAVSYRVIGRIDVKRMLKEKILDEPGASGIFQDQGYSKQDADRLVSLYVKLAQSPTTKQVSKSYLAEILKSYEIGLIDHDTAQQNYATELENDETPEEALPHAAVAIAMVDLRAANKLGQRAINAVRKDFLSGAITADEAGQQLSDMNIAPGRKQEYLQTWMIDLTRPRRVAASNTVIEWYRRGFISKPDVESRLFNLGWNNTDVLLWTTTAERKIGEDVSAEQKRAAMDEEKRAREAERRAKEAESNANKAKADLMKHSSPALMQRWYTRDIIDEQTVRDRFAQLGWPQDDVDRWFDALSPTT